jgi:curved DNA-binding protein CbpA
LTIEKAYHILGISHQASTEDIRVAYRRKALELHPDRHGSSQAKAFYAEKFQELKEAYELIKQGGYPAPAPESEPDSRPAPRVAGRSFSRRDPEQAPLSEKLGLQLSWNSESLIFWGIVMPLAAVVLVFAVRFFAAKINP